MLTVEQLYILCNNWNSKNMVIIGIDNDSIYLNYSSYEEMPQEYKKRCVLSFTLYFMSGESPTISLSIL